MISRDSGGPLPAGNGWRPIYNCEDCGSSYSGGIHVCRQGARETECETEREVA